MLDARSETAPPAPLVALRGRFVPSRIRSVCGGGRRLGRFDAARTEREDAEMEAAFVRSATWRDVGGDIIFRSYCLTSLSPLPYSVGWQGVYIGKMPADGELFLFTSESVNEGHPDKLCDQACNI